MLFRIAVFGCFICTALATAFATAGNTSDTKSAAGAGAALYVPQGFEIELVHSADTKTEGSWICMAKDHKGRLIISGQQNQPILRITMKAEGGASIEKLKLPISGAMGMLYAFDSFYVNGIGPKGFGLYRCKDTKGADQYDDIQLLKRFNGGGEHGPHGVALGPDNKIYVMNGNHTTVPDGTAPGSPYRNYREDFLLPRQWDGNGHAAGILAPGGYVVRTDADGKTWELMLGGFRNAYDIAFNPDGELFTFDSDMEWDWGMPWYRPIRINHCTSAAEFGWRSGTGVWPAFFLDSLGSQLDVGIGSPTGMSNGIGAKFPVKYQKAIYALDWTYGRIFAVHLKPNGSAYTAESELFVAPKGLVVKGAPKKNLNVTDIVIGDDGALYFTTGGRNTQGALYRVRYLGKEPSAALRAADLVNAEGAAERKLRRELETYHNGKPDPQAIEKAWPHLASKDRHLQFAARLAIENQPAAQWQERALSEKSPETAFASLVGLVRVGDPKTQERLLECLEQFPLAKLNDKQKLDKLRTLQLSFIRQGQPSFARTKKILAELEGRFPEANELVNRETVQILIYLRSTKVLDKALAHMRAVPTQEDQYHYIFHLRTLPIGFWSLPQRREYLSYFARDHKFPGHSRETLDWFEQAKRPYSNGASYANFLKNFLKEAVANMSEQERTQLAAEIKAVAQVAIPTYETKPRRFVKTWTMEEVRPQLDKVAQGRNFERGRDAFIAGQCIKCHRMGDIGGGAGPDLTAVSSRFSRRDILESILEPSKVISEQYQNISVTTLTGKTVIGRLVDETPGKIVLQPDPLSGERVEIAVKDIDSRVASKISPMPASLVDVLTADEILDLIAYVEASGQRQHAVFSKK
jgi:putative heme-binding domain-containing protein